MLQTLYALAHLDNQLAGARSYEAAFGVMHCLRLSTDDFAEQFRRMVFNVLARNQDDHTKNIAYLMDMTAQAITQWSEFAATAGVDEATARRIAQSHRAFG